MEATNWQCPKCETVNSGNFCKVCGCQKPPVNFSGNTQDTFNPRTQFEQPDFGGAPQPGYQNPTGMPVAGTPYPTSVPMTGTPASNPAGGSVTGTPMAGTPVSTPTGTPTPTGPVSSTDLAPTASKSKSNAGKIILVILMYVLSVVLIMWVSIAIGTALLAASAGYTVRIVNQSKNEKLKAEAERKRLDSKR